MGIICMLTDMIDIVMHNYILSSISLSALAASFFLAGLAHDDVKDSLLHCGRILICKDLQDLMLAADKW